MTYAELKAKINGKRRAKVTVPAAKGGGNAGTGTISQPVASDAASAELWTITCDDASNGGAGEFTVTGASSGLQANRLIAGCEYISDSGEVSFIISASGDWALTDEFTFTVSQDGAGLTETTKIRKLDFEIHSRVDTVKIGYDATNDLLSCVRVT